MEKKNRLQNLFSALMSKCKSLWPHEEKSTLKKWALFLFRLYVQWQVLIVYLLVNLLHYIFYTAAGGAFYALAAGSAYYRLPGQNDLSDWQIFSILYIFFVFGLGVSLYLFFLIPSVRTFFDKHLGEGYVVSRIGNSGKVAAIVGTLAIGGYMWNHNSQREASAEMTRNSLKEVEETRLLRIEQADHDRNTRIEITQMFTTNPKDLIKAIDVANAEYGKSVAKIDDQTAKERALLIAAGSENTKSDAERVDNRVKQLITYKTVSYNVYRAFDRFGASVSQFVSDCGNGIKNLFGGSGSGGGSSSGSGGGSSSGSGGGSGSSAATGGFGSLGGAFSLILPLQRFLEDFISRYIELTEERWRQISSFLSSLYSFLLSLVKGTGWR